MTGPTGRCRSMSPPPARWWRNMPVAVPTGSSAPAARGRTLYAETLLPNVAEGLKASQKPDRPYDRMIEMKVSFDTDRQRAMEDTRHWAALALTPEEKVSVEDPREMEQLAAALPVERAASRWIVSTDPDEHVEKIRPYVELGFRHLVFHAPGPDQERFLRLYSAQVLPKLRAAFRLSRPSSVTVPIRMTAHSALELFAVPGLPMVRAGDDLAALIADGLARARPTCATATWWWWRRRSSPRPRVALVDLATVTPSAEAVALAAEVGKDPRLVQVILSESTRVVRKRPNLLIMQHRLGLRDGQCRRRPVQRRRAEGKRARAAVAARPGRLRRAPARRAGPTLRRADRRDHQRQLRPTPGAAAPAASRSARPGCRR